jgi:multicomponent Na+:H+ antiporter subunit G
MIEARLYLVDGLVIAALVFLTTAVAGLWRFPGIYNRLHAASQGLWLGLLPLVLATFVTGNAAIAAKMVLLVMFLLLTTPVAAHAVGHAARHRAREPEEESKGH